MPLPRCLALCLVALAGFARADEPPPPRVRLAVALVFDQLRGDYPVRWHKYFGDGGFRRFLDDGAWFQNCHYPYALTVTGAGHASLVTGCSPDVHGIIGNEWYDRAAGDEAYCAARTRYQVVPKFPPPEVEKSDPDKKPDPARKPRKKDFGGGTPDLLLAPTLADVLKTATGGKGRVVSLSYKDRSAVLPGGRRPDSCYWIDWAGHLVTSNYYRDGLQPWAAKFNARRVADRWFGKEWTRLRPDLDYDALVGPDDVIGEGGKSTAQGRTFPHPFGKKTLRPGKQYYEAVYTSPMGNEVLLEAVKTAVSETGLGTRDVPDLLCVSFSSNDVVGHAWGPDSQEVFDTTLRTDLILRDLFAFLDDKVGKGRYTVALSADHGICPLPEVSLRQKKDAGRISPRRLIQIADEFLQETYGEAAEPKNKEGKRPGAVESAAGGMLYLNRRWLKTISASQTEIEEALARWLETQRGILRAYTRTQLLKADGVKADDAIGQRVLKSFHPERSGDVMPVLKPLYLLSGPLEAGTSHGTPHDYDTHVLLLVYGPGVKPGVRKELVTPQAMAAVLAHALGMPPPAKAEAPVPPGLFEK